MEFTDYIDQAHDNAVEKGFWDQKREIGTLLMLIVSELGEALEAHRKDRFADLETFDRELLKGESFKEIHKRYLKDTFEDEIADTFIRLFDLCGGLNIAIEDIIQLKMEYNSQREKLHGKKY